MIGGLNTRRLFPPRAIGRPRRVRLGPACPEQPLFAARKGEPPALTRERPVDQSNQAFARSRKKRPPSALFEVSTPPFSRMKVTGSAVRFPLPSM